MKDEIDGFLKLNREHSRLLCTARRQENVDNSPKLGHCVALGSAQWSLVVLQYFPWMCVSANKVK